MGAIPDLGAGGAALWEAITADHELDAAQSVTLLEVCRAKDRLDKLDRLLSGEIDTWATLTHRLNTDDYELKIDAALAQANSTANLMKQLIASLRLPDATSGKRPQQRGGGRGSYKPGGTAAVTSLDRARAAKSS